MVEGKTCYYVRLDVNDKRYWHWRLAKRDRLDVFHNGDWYVMLAWTDLLTTKTPTAEVTLMLRQDFVETRRDAQADPVLPETALVRMVV